MHSEAYRNKANMYTYSLSTYRNTSLRCVHETCVIQHTITGYRHTDWSNFH